MELRTNTITLPQKMYNDIKAYADKENVSVQDYVVKLIARLYPTKIKFTKKEYTMKKNEELSPVLQDILNMPRFGTISGEDVNGDKAREEYYREKYDLA